MAQIVHLLRTPEISVHRFNHPAAHEDQPYVEHATAYMASFVEDGRFNLEVDGKGWRVAEGDVMLSRPGMKFRASFDGEAFNDTCITLTYLAARADGFDPLHSWMRSNRSVLPSGNRVRYLRWGLQRAVTTNSTMFAEYCATEIFREVPQGKSEQKLSARKFDWYAERVEYARERLGRDLEENLTASDLAREVGMSMFHFTRIFAELVGTPPHRYRLKERLSAARRMILDGRSVTETCFACGFNNLSHFTRSFSDRFGAPPSRITA
jgi:AraC-like DNA-binding protein